MESRKIRKPLMEKKRRARINDSLESLKQILLATTTNLKDTTNKKTGQKSAKLEKADILEMTVKYLQQLQNKLAKLENVNPSRTQMRLLPTRLDNRDIIFLLPSTDLIHNSKELTNKIELDSHIWRPW